MSRCECSGTLEGERVWPRMASLAIGPTYTSCALIGCRLRFGQNMADSIQFCVGAVLANRYVHNTVPKNIEFYDTFTLVE